MFTGRRQRGRYFCVQFNHLAPRMRYATSANPRTSSATNVGVDKDSEKRQRAAIGAYAKRAGYALVAGFYDAAVSGADPIQDRPGFAALLDRIEANGVCTVLVEDASRFARELMAQELGIALLISRGVNLVTASGDGLTASDDPSRKMICPCPDGRGVHHQNAREQGWMLGRPQRACSVNLVRWRAAAGEYDDGHVGLSADTD